MSSPNWAVAFGITDNDLADLKDQLQPNEDPLRWILSNGYIPSGDYVAWARETYQLPSVKDEFFSIPADPVFWEAVKNEFAWTPAFMPLAEWQGVFLIACLQPPTFHFPFHQPHRFVVAAAHCLEHRYRELEPVQSPHEQEAPAASHDAVAEVRQRPSDEYLADSLPQAPDVDMHDPEGLVVNVPDHLDPNMFVVPEGMDINDLGQPVPTSPDGFEGGSQLIDLDSFNFSDSDPMASAKKIEASEAVAHAKAHVQSPTPPAAPVAPAAPPKTATVVPPRTPVVPPGPPAAFAEVAPSIPKSMPPPAPQFSRAHVSSTEPAVPLATCASIEGLTSAVIAHVNVHFEHAMLMMYENSQLKPTKWSELLLSVKGDNADPVQLELPSVFRIAARTSLPYHGYVATNPTNQSFFNSFNRGVVPKHLTAMPVMINGQLTAMLVGLSMNAVDYKASLAAMEKISSDFATQLERLRGRRLANATAAA